MDVRGLSQSGTVLTTMGNTIPFRRCSIQFTHHHCHRIAFALPSHFTPKSPPLGALNCEATILSTPSPASSSRLISRQGSRRRIKYHHHPHPFLFLVAAGPNPHGPKEGDPREDKGEAGLKVKVETSASGTPENAENFQQTPSASASASETVRVKEEAKVEKDEFWRGVLEETARIEWPPFQKVLGTTGVVLAVMVGSSAVLLTVNAILAEISDKIFNGIGVQDILWGISK